MLPSLPHRSVQAGIYPNVMVAARNIVAAAGPRGLFTGYLPTLLEDIPDMAFKFAAYESLRAARMRLMRGRKATVQVRFQGLEGIECTRLCCEGPPRAARLRLARWAQGHRAAATFCDQRSLSCNRMCLLVHSWSRVSSQLVSSSQPSRWLLIVEVHFALQEDFCMGAVSGAFAAAATTPLDVIKTTMMCSAASRPTMTSAAVAAWQNVRR